MHVDVRLTLPRDEASVPVTRHVVSQALQVLGVSPDVIADVKLALTEACANVLKHAPQGTEYEVRAGFDDQRVFLEIVDQGHGFDADEAEREIGPGPAPESESGRGVQLMRDLMDTVRIEARAGGDGTCVLLEKRLEWSPGAPIERLAEAGS